MRFSIDAGETITPSSERLAKYATPYAACCAALFRAFDASRGGLALFGATVQIRAHRGRRMIPFGYATSQGDLYAYAYRSNPGSASPPGLSLMGRNRIILTSAEASAEGKPWRSIPA